MTFADYDKLRLARPELKLDPSHLLIPGEKDVVARITPDELAAFCSGMLLAGHEGGWCWLAKYPDEQAARKIFDKIVDQNMTGV